MQFRTGSHVRYKFCSKSLGTENQAYMTGLETTISYVRIQGCKHSAIVERNRQTFGKLGICPLPVGLLLTCDDLRSLGVIRCTFKLKKKQTNNFSIHYSYSLHMVLNFPTILSHKSS